VFVDIDGNGTQDATEPYDFALNSYIAAEAASVTLIPATETNFVGTTHSVMAIVRDVYGNRISSIPERRVYAFVSGSVTTFTGCKIDATGSCTFTYMGPDFPGADLITAWFDIHGDGAPDPWDPVAEASAFWILPTSTPGHVSGGGNFDFADERLAFGFSARDTDQGLKGRCNVVDRAARVIVECQDVISFVISDNAVTVYGNALVNGVPTLYRIDAADNATRGRGADTFSIQTASGYTRAGTLVGGNVRVE
jgi:hypothetical protein